MPDISINPSSLVTASATVSTANPLPCVLSAAAVTADDVTINPTSFVVNDAIVSATNPLPILLG